ncbi:AAA-like domain-containing protein [Oscillatoria sp. FACHB-1407]|uniref:AAA-like domain-containing protein n=1 Tax=Oscillatoria sp. FACHB-1407 TaxID=2692847 RepID=UPI001685EC93|nr:AAA-like domain-containing protein [Oscillatoria sp. FACHB-1407]MBD2461195.1 AAA-like domain-containing protein [Oscillatoria sp. FACHB-1407]
MDAKTALEFVDGLIYDQTGKHLSNLERDVFMGSWQGQTYEEIYPNNPEYVEKYVGYKLWQKLSTVLGEKVTKKQFRGALERTFQRQTHSSVAVLSQEATRVEKMSEQAVKQIFVSHRSQEPDRCLATDLCEAIATAGHHILMVDTGIIPTTYGQSDRDWLTHIDACLARCDFFILLLSPQAAVSEMVLEELRRVKELQSKSHRYHPIILPIQVNCPPEMPLNHDLQNYLRYVHQWVWQSPMDSTAVIQAIVDVINGDGANGNATLQSSSLTGLIDRQELSLTTQSPVFHIHPLAVPSPSPTLPTPCPIADPELPQGQVRLDSQFYVERSPYEARCYREIVQPGTLIRIKAPRQMGKTSLMSRILHQAREQGYRTVPLSFQHADRAVFESLDQLLQWVCTRVARRLHLPHAVDQYWSDTYGSKDNCTAYFEDCLLSEIDQPMVLALDEVDRVFQYPKIADDFFGLLRAWYEEAGYGDSDSGLWEKLRLIVVHSTEVYIPLDVNQSPFNVGLPIELSEFSPEQVSDLARRHGLNWHSDQVAQLMQIVGGHPYLVRLALYHIAQGQLTLPQLIETAPTEAGIYGDHLRRHLWNLQHHPELAIAFQRVVTSHQSVELASILAFKLHSLGLVQLQGNEVTPRFQLYQHYFGDRFGHSEV